MLARCRMVSICSPDSFAFFMADVARGHPDKLGTRQGGMSSGSREESRAGRTAQAFRSGWLLAKGPRGGRGLAHSPHTRVAVSACGLRAVLGGHRPIGASEETAAARLWGRPRGHPFTVRSRGCLEFGGSDSLALEVLPTMPSAGLAHGLEEDRILSTQMEEARVMSSAQTQPSFSSPPARYITGGWAQAQRQDPSTVISHLPPTSRLQPLCRRPRCPHVANTGPSGGALCPGYGSEPPTTVFPGRLPRPSLSGCACVEDDSAPWAPPMALSLGCIPPAPGGSPSPATT